MCVLSEFLVPGGAGWLWASLLITFVPTDAVPECMHDRQVCLLLWLTLTPFSLLPALQQAMHEHAAACVCLRLLAAVTTTTLVLGRVVLRLCLFVVVVMGSGVEVEATPAVLSVHDRLYFCLQQPAAALRQCCTQARSILCTHLSLPQLTACLPD